MNLTHRYSQWTLHLPFVADMAVVFLLAAMLLVACGGQTVVGGKSAATSTATANPKLFYRPGQGPGIWNPYAQVTFTRSTSYATALRLVTDLGLQPAWPCAGIGGGGYTPWQSKGLGQADTYTEGLGPHLWVFVASRSVSDFDVMLYYAAPPDWPMRLSQHSAVTLVDDRSPHCPLGPSVDLTPVPGRAYFLDPAQTPTYVQLSFAAGTLYDQALAAVSALGFRLADPCFEQAQPKPTWHPMGQETTYAATNRLVIATTGANATTWKQQLASTAGVTGVQKPYHPT